MKFINELLMNRVLIVAGSAWLVAGVLKMIIELVINKKLSVSRIVGAGGMPSSHTATVIALAIAVAYESGVSSVQFALAVIFAIVVIHDAVGVRLETGKQAKVLNTMMFESKAFEDIDFEKQLKEYIGHTPLQALVGAIIGVVVAVVYIKVLY